MADKVDVRKVFQAIADIIGDREGVKIEVVSVRKKTEEEREKEQNA